MWVNDKMTLLGLLALMAQNDPHFKIRMPPDLKDRLERAAKSQNRSITAEIVSRLEDSFPIPIQPDLPGLAQSDASMAELLRAFSRMDAASIKALVALVRAAQERDMP